MSYCTTLIKMSKIINDEKMKLEIKSQLLGKDSQIPV